MYIKTKIQLMYAISARNTVQLKGYLAKAKLNALNMIKLYIYTDLVLKNTLKFTKNNIILKFLMIIIYIYQINISVELFRETNSNKKKPNIKIKIKYYLYILYSRFRIIFHFFYI